MIRQRFSTKVLPGAAALLGMAFLGSITASGQNAAASKTSGEANHQSTWTVPRLADGHPDLEGIWTNKTITPLERPKALGNKAFFTPEEAKKFTQATLERTNKDRRGGGVRDVLNAYNAFWWDSGTKVLPNMRTSIITDPPDGRIPPLTAHREAQMQEEREAIKIRCERPGCEIANSGQPMPSDNPKDLDLMTRCISFGTVVPMLPSAYNNDYQIVQSPGTVAIDTEMVHEVRRIPTNASPHLPSNVREWYGDPRGHWEGDTFVVDSTNFNGQLGGRMRAADKNLHIIERFTRVGPNTLLYRFTVDDPTAFTKPWSGEIPLTKISGLLYEYACHEGNIGMRDILTAAKRDEKKAAAAQAAAKKN
jgi:hypothetical protein